MKKKNLADENLSILKKRVSRRGYDFISTGKLNTDLIKIKKLTTNMGIAIYKGFSYYLDREKKLDKICSIYKKFIKLANDFKIASDYKDMVVESLLRKIAAFEVVPVKYKVFARKEFREISYIGTNNKVIERIEAKQETPDSKDHHNHTLVTGLLGWMHNVLVEKVGSNHKFW